MPDRIKADREAREARAGELLSGGMQPSGAARVLVEEFGLGERQAFRLVSEARERRRAEDGRLAAEAASSRRRLDAEMLSHIESTGTELVGADGGAVPAELSGPWGELHWVVRARQLSKLEQVEGDIELVYRTAESPSVRLGALRLRMQAVAEQNKMLGVSGPPVVERRVRAESEEEGEADGALAALAARAEEMASVTEVQERLRAEREEREARLAELDRRRAEAMEAELASRVRAGVGEEQEGVWWELLGAGDAD